VRRSLPSPEQLRRRADSWARPEIRSHAPPDVGCLLGGTRLGPTAAQWTRAVARRGSGTPALCAGGLPVAPGLDVCALDAEGLEPQSEVVTSWGRLEGLSRLDRALNENTGYDGRREPGSALRHRPGRDMIDPIL
jgi:hypothetical protein